MIRKLLSLSRYSLLSAAALGFGLIRELTVSAKFGLNEQLDVYLAMSGFYLFFGAQIGNALEMVFISKSAKLDNAERVTEQLAKMVKALLSINLLTVLILHASSDYLIKWIFPGFTTAQIDLGVTLLAWLFVAIVFANLSGLMRASLNVLRIFTPGMLAGSIISVSSTIAVYFYGDALGIKALLYGFIIGNGLVFFMTSLAFLRVAEFGYRKRMHTAKLLEDGIWKAVAIVIIGELAFQGFSMTEKSFASTLAPGTVSAFFYAWTLVSIPLSLVVMPLSTVAYPRLAETFGKDRRQGFVMLKRYGGAFFLFGLVIVTVVSELSEYLVKLVFMRGRFSMDDAEKTSEILSILIFCLPLLSVSRLTRYSLYSLSNYKGPALALVSSWAVIAISGYALVPIYGVIGLAYSSTFAVITEAISMLLILRISLRHT